MTKKEIIKAKLEFYKNNNIDTRTLPMIVNHFISIGCQRAEKINDREINKVYERLKAEEKEAKANHKIMIMTPEFQVYLLQACHSLSQLDLSVRNAIIKENI